MDFYSPHNIKENINFDRYKSHTFNSKQYNQIHFLRMESPNPTSNSTTTSEPPLKRKRTPINDSAPPPPSLHPTTNNVTQINYLAKARSEKLRLIEGDAETFGDVLGMIDDYEG